MHLSFGCIINWSSFSITIGESVFVLLCFEICSFGYRWVIFTGFNGICTTYFYCVGLLIIWLPVPVMMAIASSSSSSSSTSLFNSINHLDGGRIGLYLGSIIPDQSTIPCGIICFLSSLPV